MKLIEFTMIVFTQILLNPVLFQIRDRHYTDAIKLLEDIEMHFVMYKNVKCFQHCVKFFTYIRSTKTNFMCVDGFIE